MVTIKHITQPSAELEAAKTLFREYASELNENLCFQSFDDELANPLKKYGPPKGGLLLAYYNNELAGCIALQALQQQGVCEMKRLYVRPAYRKFKIGAALVEALLKEAEAKGYQKMVLDTLERLQPAIGLYTRFGFVNTSAYYENPLQNVVYMEKALQ